VSECILHAFQGCYGLGLGLKAKFCGLGLVVFGLGLGIDGVDKEKK